MKEFEDFSQNEEGKGRIMNFPKEIFKKTKFSQFLVCNFFSCSQVDESVFASKVCFQCFSLKFCHFYAVLAAKKPKICKSGNQEGKRRIFGEKKQKKEGISKISKGILSMHR